MLRGFSSICACQPPRLASRRKPIASEACAPGGNSGRTQTRGSPPVRLRARQLERAIAPTAKIERKRVYLPVSPPRLETFEAEIASFLMSKYSTRSIPWCSSSTCSTIAIGGPWTCRLRASTGSSRFDRRASLLGKRSRSRGASQCLPCCAKRSPSAGNSSHTGLIASMRRARPPPITHATSVAPPWWSDPKRPPRRSRQYWIRT
jgi:hypothetical protein